MFWIIYFIGGFVSAALTIRVWKLDHEIDFGFLPEVYMTAFLSLVFFWLSWVGALYLYLVIILMKIKQREEGINNER